MDPDDTGDLGIVAITSRVADAYGLDRQARIGFAFTMAWVWNIIDRSDLGGQLAEYAASLAV